MMTRRKLIESSAIGATGVFVLAGRARGQAAAASGQEHQHSMFKTCAVACADCARACNEAFRHCLTQAASGKAEHARMAQITADCAEFCALSSEMLQRKSSLAILSCTACADACRICAQECSSSNSGAEMKSCAEECRRCEESCRKMIQGHTAAVNEAPQLNTRRAGRQPQN